MIVRNLKAQTFDSFEKQLFQKAQQNPLDACFQVNITVNRAEYCLKLQPEKNCKIAVLQVLKIYREEDGPDFELITDNKILSSLLELLIFQGVPAKI